MEPGKTPQNRERSPEEKRWDLMITVVRTTMREDQQHIATRLERASSGSPETKTNALQEAHNDLVKVLNTLRARQEELKNKKKLSDDERIELFSIGLTIPDYEMVINVLNDAMKEHGAKKMDEFDR